jgi:hypothetical protein
LKMRIVKFDRAIACQILEMDERFRSHRTEPSTVYRSSNGISIFSGRRPDFRNRDIYLRGDDRLRDNDVAWIVFASDEERDIYHGKMILALKEWAEKWEGWETETVNKGESHVDDMILEL